MLIENSCNSRRLFLLLLLCIVLNSIRMLAPFVLLFGGCISYQALEMYVNCVVENERIVIYQMEQLSVYIMQRMIRSESNLNIHYTLYTCKSITTFWNRYKIKKANKHVCSV